MSLKILLTADVHLGMKFAAFPKVQQELSQTRFETLRTIVSLANENKCDLFVVAGDLFDRQTLSDHDVVLAAQIISEFQGKLAAVLPGNHDFLLPGESKLWQKFQSNAQDRVLLLHEPKPYPLRHYDMDAILYPGPCNARHSEVNRIEWIKEVPKDSSVRHHIGIAHGSLIGLSPDPERKFYPMTEEELKDAGLDIWLMGHTDRMQYPEAPSQFARIFYPGTPEPNGFDCQHPGSVWLFQIDDNKKISASSILTGKHRFIHHEAVLTNDSDLDALLKKFSAGVYKQDLIKLSLKGHLPKDSYARLSQVLSEIDDSVFYLHPPDTSGLAEEITLEEIDREFAQQSFPHRLLKSLSAIEDSSEALQIAYELIQEAKK